MNGGRQVPLRPRPAVFSAICNRCVLPCSAYRRTSRAGGSCDDHTSTEAASTEAAPIEAGIPQPTAKKKPYRKPELVKLGNLADITRSTGYFGQNDGGRFPRGFKTGH